MDSDVGRKTAVRDLVAAADGHRAADMFSSAIEFLEEAVRREGELEDHEQIEVRLQLYECLHAKSRFEDSKQALVPVLGRDDLGPEDRARVLSRVGWADFFLGRVESCVALCRQAVDLLLPTGLHDELAQALRWLGCSLKWMGSVEESEELLRDALAAARRSEGSPQLIDCLRALGNLCRSFGNYETAIRLHEEARSLSQERGRLRSVALENHHLALARLYLGQWDQARQDIDAALRICAEIGLVSERVSSLLTQARLLRRVGERTEAKHAAEMALALAVETGFCRAQIVAKEELGDIAREEDDLVAARALYEEALVAARNLGPRADVVHEVSWRLSRTHLELDSANKARNLAIGAVKGARDCGDRRELAHSLATLSLCESRRGDFATAATFLNEALDVFSSIGAPFELAGAHEEAALILGLQEGRAASRLAHLYQAAELYSRLGLDSCRTRVVQQIEEVEGLPARETPIRSEGEGGDHNILTCDDEMIRLVGLARDLAGQSATVLVEGETGTGKELIARLMHDSGARRSNPYFPLNCSALTDQLLESELFGHARGSFTGAVRERAGVLEAAGNGTVLLDEIDKAPKSFQAKLLRVLEERKIRRVGASTFIDLKARILCASNRDLRLLVEKGEFLPDLYYRIAAFRLVLPPLRERRGDIVLLCQHFLEKGSSSGRRRYVLTPEAKEVLESYDWPGNVREVKNAMQAIAFFAKGDGVVRIDHIPNEIRNPIRPPKDDTLGGQIEELERRHILAALERARGVKTEAAKILGVSRKGLNDRLKRLGLE